MMKDVYVKAKLIAGCDRNSNCIIEVRETHGHTTQVNCTTYDISSQKADTEQILRGLSIKHNRMMEESSSFKEKELISKIFSEIEKTIKVYQ